VAILYDICTTSATHFADHSKTLPIVFSVTYCRVVILRQSPTEATMRIVQFLFFTISLFMGGLSFAQGKTMPTMHGVIPEIPKEFTMRGEVIVMMFDSTGRRIIISYAQCLNSDRVEVTWWYSGELEARRVDCSGTISEEDIRSRAVWIVPVPMR
jgi:hypothetical protein